MNVRVDTVVATVKTQSVLGYQVVKVRCVQVMEYATIQTRVSARRNMKDSIVQSPFALEAIQPMRLFVLVMEPVHLLICVSVIENMKDWIAPSLFAFKRIQQMIQSAQDMVSAHLLTFVIASGDILDSIVLSLSFPFASE